MKYLLDTNILSEPCKPDPNPRVLAKLDLYWGQLATSSVVLHELRFGCMRLPESKRKELLQDYLENTVQPCLSILPYDAEAAQWHALQRSYLLAKGITPQFTDGQIAAVAHINDLILVTHNIKDFACFPDLHIEDWFA